MIYGRFGYKDLKPVIPFSRLSGVRYQAGCDNGVRRVYGGGDEKEKYPLVY